MKLMIASDLHGSAYYTRLLLTAMDREQPDRLLLLGDLLYHGPRNDLPREYAPKQVIEMLNARKSQILCVRGNCEAEVDQMVLEFPVLSEFGVVFSDGLTLYAPWAQESGPSRTARGHPALRAHPCSGGAEGRGTLLCQPRFRVHPQGGELPRVYDAGKPAAPSCFPGGRKYAARLHILKIM